MPINPFWIVLLYIAAQCLFKKENARAYRIYEFTEESPRLQELP